MMDWGIRILLRCYPAKFRTQWGEEYTAFLRAQRAEARYRGPFGAIRFWTEAFASAAVQSVARRFAPTALQRIDPLVAAGAVSTGWSGSLEDLRSAVRGLSRAPWFTSVVVLTLGLALGANTAVFSVINGALLAPLPYQDGQRLVAIWNDMPAMEWFERQVGRWVYDELERTVDGEFPIEAIAATKHERVNLVTDDVPVSAQSLRASAGFFEVFGVRPALGRTFTASEDQPGADRVAVLSHGLWQRAFGADPDILGRMIESNGVRREVVGVLDPDFIPPRGNAELIFPLALDRSNPPQPGGNDHYVYGKLRPGAVDVEVASQMDAFSVSLDDIYTQIDLARFGFRVYTVPLDQNLAKGVRPALFLLMGTVALILLVACANVTNLLLSRAEGLRRERSLRLALGAGRSRIARLAVAESLVLAGGGAIAGTVFAMGAVGLIDRLPPDLLPTTARVGIAGAPLLFTALVTLVAGAIVGVLPALRSMKAEPGEALRVGGRGSADGGRGWVRGGLVVSQVALSVLLLIGATLLGRSFLAVNAVEVGMDVSSVVTFDMILPIERYDTPEAASGFVQQLQEALEASPQITAVGAADQLPLADEFILTAFEVAGREESDFGGFLPDAYRQVVSPEFLPTLGIPLLRGRWWSGADGLDAPPTVMVNRAFAESFFPEGKALGERVGIFATNQIEIIGVVEDSRFNRLDEPTGPMIYYNFDQWSSVVGKWVGFYSDPDGIPLSVVIRTTGGTAPMEAFIRRELAGVDPTIPVTRLRSMGRVVNASMAERRLLLLSIAAFAFVGLVLGALGTYAVLSYAIAARAREMGIRLALGATPTGLLRLTTLSGLRMTVLGLALGVGGALTLSRVLQGLLFSVTPTDPASYVAVSTLVLVVATAACWLPARRAARTDPAVAFRSD